MNNLIITGFMATGKTSVGMVLARLLGMRFVDTDQLIEKIEGRPVSEIFSVSGESHFRKCESEICGSLANLTDTVIATGGGTLLDEGNLEKLGSSGRVFCLNAPPDVIAERVTSTESRPLLESEKKEESIRRLLEKRASRYETMGGSVDASDASAMELAFRIVESLAIPSEKLTIRMGDEQYPVFVGRAVSLGLGAFLAEKARGARIFVAGPERVLELFGDQVQHSLSREGITAETIVVNDGEQYKNLDETERLIDLLVKRGVERSSVIIALGGGVTGDLVGFVSSVLMRGVGLVHVPTTLLAQVDSSVGGKVAVNRGGIKNIVGAFYRPTAVFVDPCFLLTLGRSEIANGMAEIVKAAVIGSEELFSMLESMLENGELSNENIELMERVIRRALGIKAEIVSEDPYETGKRRVLNFGHTFGHVLESLQGLKNLAHGEAVALGMLAATSIAVSRGYAEGSLLERLRGVIRGANLPIRTSNYSIEQVRHAMSLDKKASEGRVHFVLPERIGRMRIVSDVSEKEISDALKEISNGE